MLRSLSLDGGNSIPLSGWRIRQRAERSIRRWPLGALAAAVVLLMIVSAVFAPVIAPFDPSEIHRADRLQSPNSTYWLGSDTFGRDLLSRLIYGSRISLVAGFAPIVLSVIVGTAIGCTSAFLGRTFDAVIQRVMDALMAFPAILLALVIVSMLGPSLRNIVIVIAIVTVPTLNRIARAATISVLAEVYVDAARSLGATGTRLILRHVLPNIVAPVMIIASGMVGGAILAEASLSFLGVGIQPPAASWGNLLGGSDRDLFEVAPWLAIFPGIVISLAVLSTNLIGDTLRDALDPRRRRSAG